MYSYIKKMHEFFVCRIFDIVVTPVSLKDRANESILRVLKCYCYNTLIKMVRAVPKPVNFYAHIFHEKVDKKLFIWQSIIDSNENFNLKMFIDEVSFLEMREIILNLFH